jgi:hypothetical protein
MLIEPYHSKSVGTDHPSIDPGVPRPGEIELTLKPALPLSSANALVSMFIPALLVA